MTSPTTPWADAPFSLIATPGRGQDSTKIHGSVYMAREMAYAHNGMIRGLNSLYHQSLFVRQPKDIQDILLFTKFWCGWLHKHHEAEEANFFPRIEEITGKKGLMEVNVAQHHSFESGLLKLENYGKETKVDEYDGKKLREIIDEFGAEVDCTFN